MAILVPDTTLTFPEFVLLRASAGSGKTHALSLRFVQLLLSDKIGKKTSSDLRNVLAITFTKNAAREMKTRILDWLKECYFEDAEKSGEILGIVSIPKARLPEAAGRLIEKILARYTDFQVETIDSFMTSIFRASAVELGHAPDFEIVLDNTELIRYAFSRHLRSVTARSGEGRLFRRVLDHLTANLPNDAAYPWDPTVPVSEKLFSLYTKLAVRNRRLEIKNRDRERDRLHKSLVKAAQELESLIRESGMELDGRGHAHSKIFPAVRNGHFPVLISCSFKTPPVKNPRTPQQAEEHKRIMKGWDALETIVDRYRSLYARDFFAPYLQAYESLEGTLDQVKRQRGTVFIEDINKQLAQYIEAGIVPDIYFRLGDFIVHYLIDEFQDTNRIQWDTLFPLIEESLSKAGSLFVVGDVKQAIYGFRDADWRVMESLDPRDGEGNIRRFLSAEVQPRRLDKNYRSGERIQAFVNDIFRGRLPLHKDFEDIAEVKRIYEFEQTVVEKNRGKGYVEYIEFDKDAESRPEKGEIQNRIRELRDRGYAWSDIAVLTYRNESVVEISSWLNEKGIPFIPYSSLDIRKRKIIGEIVAFLRFLDSPPDDLSFTVFLLGDLFAKKAALDGAASGENSWQAFLFENRVSRGRPLYAAFRSARPDLWERYFDPFFKAVGYYPLYDLATLIFRVFDVYALFPDEEASLTKFLEVINHFEGQGRNDLQTFLEFTESGEGEDADWTIDVPSETPAVRIMSIHKAKGLGFPVVLFLVYGEGFRPSGFYLGEDDTRIRVVKIDQNLKDADEELAQIYREARTRDTVERLNRLYVGLTRAKAELYVIGVTGSRDSYPFDLLKGAAEGLNLERLAERQWASARAKPAACPGSLAADSPTAAKLLLTGPFELPPNRREILNIERIRRGEIAHAIMAGFEFLGAGWEPDIAGVLRGLAPRENETALYEAIGRSLISYFRNSPRQELFRKKDGRLVLREFDFCDGSGAVHRMDRVVVDAGEVTVIDFKTGAETAAPSQADWDRADREQVETYVRILKEIYPEKSVRGILAYIDRNRWEAVE